MILTLNGGRTSIGLSAIVSQAAFPVSVEVEATIEAESGDSGALHVEVLLEWRGDVGDARDREQRKA